jgi:GTP diphosphokinase / guanosine-3',5'-bis(diphosphate) 3'-diphosphatase
MYIIDEEAERKEILRRYRYLFTVWKRNILPEERLLIRKAFNLAVKAHKDMRRKSGEPYIYHPLEVARIVIQEIGLGTTSVVCALLHDVVEDSDFISLSDIQNMFGEKVARIIDGLTKIEEIFDQGSLSLQAENFKKILLTLSDDVRVILIKLADRLHNMRTLDSMPHGKQLKIASETIYLYAPLAHRLGLHTLKSELEDLSLKYTEPEVYQTITEKIRESEPERARFIHQFIYPIKKALTEQGFSFAITGRVKSVYSIWGKMKKKEIPFEEVYDLFAIRIVLDSPAENEKSDCWRVYSIITDFYKPNHERLRDWLSIPKANGYEALHTTVMSHIGQWVEVQIRSKRTDEIAEKGYAAHWKYKENSPIQTAEQGLDEWLNRIREILENPDSNALDFLNDFKLNLFSDEMYAFTPKGEMKTLPVRSTVLDFAYSIHSDIGNTCIGAKVNHKLVPLNFQLKSGDQVEVITSKKQKPQVEWNDFVVTARAKTRIKQFLKEERRAITELGKTTLEQIYLKNGIEFNIQNIKFFRDFMSISSTQELYFLFSIGTVTDEDFKECFQKEKSGWFQSITKPFTRSKKQVDNRAKSLKEEILRQVKDTPEQVVLDENTENLSYSTSKCCNAIPGDDVIGIITPDQGIKIHRINCKEAIKIMSQHGNRIVKAKWRQDDIINFLTGLKIDGIDRKGIVNDFAHVISQELDINIRSFNLESSEGVFEGVIMIYINNASSLINLISKLKEIDGVEHVTRIS